MIRATSVEPGGTWHEAPRDVVVLGYDDRHRRRLAMRGIRGTAFLLDLAEAVALRGGDCLVLDDGGWIEVVAAPEPLVEITGANEAATVRIAWHLGNRHLPVQLAGRRLRIRRDHVIETMVEGLGGRLRAIEAPFDPEGGAYAGGTGTAIPTPITTRHTMSLDGSARLALHAWLSPSFPVGAFAFSHGLEWAMEAGDVADAATLEAWLDDLVVHGAPRADAVLLAAAWRAPDDLEAINALALALAPSSERHLEAAAQGTAFLSAVAAAWPTAGLAALAPAWADHDLAYPVAVGIAAAAHALPLRATLEVFALANVGNLVSAALRLGTIGQSEGQRIVARLAPAVLDLAAFAEHATLNDLGTCAWCSDIAAMRHETQYSRLFRS